MHNVTAMPIAMHKSATSTSIILFQIILRILSEAQ